MIIAERTSTPSDTAVKLTAAKDHCRIDHSDDDAEVVAMIRAATLDLEQCEQIALLTQGIRATFDPAPSETYLSLPIGPVLEGEAPTVTLGGSPFTDFELICGRRAFIRWGDTYRETVDPRVIVDYLAGFGTTATAVPDDLQHADLDRVAALYDEYSPFDQRTEAISPNMARIAARYRRVVQ